MPTLNPAAAAATAVDPDDAARRGWLIATGVAGGAAALGLVAPLGLSLAPSEQARAFGAPVEVDIGDLAPGAMRTVAWRGRPVWVVRRTPEMIASLQGLDDRLADPRSERDPSPAYVRNPTRSIRPEVFVALGVCTHLGCTPNPVAANSDNPGVGADWPGGFLCPCHGATYDGAGRVFRNKPAPTNLVVPPHRYLDAERILIGADDATA